jgi:hypothetical protein
MDAGACGGRGPLILGPLLLFVPHLSQARRVALREYGTFAQRYVRGADRQRRHSVARRPRDPEHRVLCPVLDRPITDEQTIVVDRLAHHRDCWRPTELPVASANP